MVIENGWAVLDDHPAIGEVNVVREFTSEAHLVGNEDAGHAFGGKFLDLDQPLLDGFRVECGGYFVKEHHVWVHRQRAGNGHPLLLTTGQLAGIEASRI